MPHFYTEPRDLTRNLYLPGRYFAHWVISSAFIYITCNSKWNQNECVTSICWSNTHSCEPSPTDSVRVDLTCVRLPGSTRWEQCIAYNYRHVVCSKREVCHVSSFIIHVWVQKGYCSNLLFSAIRVSNNETHTSQTFYLVYINHLRRGYWHCPLKDEEKGVSRE